MRSSLDSGFSDNQNQALKEIIANKIVERANFILENWNQNFIADNYYGNTYYKSDWLTKIQI